MKIADPGIVVMFSCLSVVAGIIIGTLIAERRPPDPPSRE